MPVYSASSTQWPLLQSKTEQKFKSGLFNVSAEFLRPVGNTALPTQIETSIGPVNVWPDPTVSVGTDGFERINATGYDVWNEEISTTETFIPVDITASLTLYRSATNGTWDAPTTHYVFLKSFGSAATFSFCTKDRSDLTQMQIPEWTPYNISQTSANAVFSAFGINLAVGNYYSDPASKTPMSLVPTYSSAWGLIDMQVQKFGDVFEVIKIFGGQFKINFGPYYPKAVADLLYP